MYCYGREICNSKMSYKNTSGNAVKDKPLCKNVCDVKTSIKRNNANNKYGSNLNDQSALCGCPPVPTDERMRRLSDPQASHQRYVSTKSNNPSLCEMSCDKNTCSLCLPTGLLMCLHSASDSLQSCQTLSWYSIKPFITILFDFFIFKTRFSADLGKTQCWK